MRGLPGSGKSTEAYMKAISHFEQGGQSVVICSTDSFFVNEEGKYVFDAKKLGKHHGMNQYLAHRHMFMNTELVIIDNTNTTDKEMAPYIASAKEFGYEITKVLVGEENLFPKMDDACPHKFADYIDMCAKRNTHGVPKEAIERMARRFEQ